MTHRLMGDIEGWMRRFRAHFLSNLSIIMRHFLRFLSIVA
ncbi:hypothetical protein PG5_21690 [Pseudomonas sp. G5(2012)]|nr:hypothetical protein PG5_21690 [Pseudomonas sp. G5(2012)]